MKSQDEDVEKQVEEDIQKQKDRKEQTELEKIENEILQTQEEDDNDLYIDTKCNVLASAQTLIIGK
jgi:hypothetical protein